MRGPSARRWRPQSWTSVARAAAAAAAAAADEAPARLLEAGGAPRLLRVLATAAAGAGGALAAVLGAAAGAPGRFLDPGADDAASGGALGSAVRETLRALVALAGGPGASVAAAEAALRLDQHPAVVGDGAFEEPAAPPPRPHEHR